MSPQVATSDTVGRAELLDFIRGRPKVVLVTAKRDGSPQLSPVTSGKGLDAAGRVVIATYPERAKIRNARGVSLQVTLMVLSDAWNGPWVQVSGTAEVA